MTNFQDLNSDDDDMNESTQIYEPDPKLISKFYCEIKEKKVLNLDWKFTGRLTPAEYEQENRADSSEMDLDDNQKDSKDNIDLNDFDFDEDFGGDSSLSSKMNPLIKKKPTPSHKKVTNLDKVMNDIKKYQKIDKQTKFGGDEEKI